MAISDTVVSAYEKAYEADPASAYGSVVGINKTVDAQTASIMVERYVEAIIAPDFDKEAVEIFSKKPNVRLMVIGEGNDLNVPMKNIRRVDGGILLQDMDRLVEDKNTMEVISKTQPTEEIWDDLLFGWKVVKHVKSNAILLVKNKQTLGVGAGQMSRVDAVELAIKKSNQDLNGSTLASDAYFPFRDSVDIAAKAGIKAIIQPGGSIRDDEVIQACNEHGIAMVTTGKRHFRH
jgi:phosphoribosylaminoimidazolecarboxamide formyltransferase/IMP cyclohydrolase